MEILVLNLGSSSIKFKLFDMKENKPLASGLAEKIGEEIGQLKIKSHLHHNDQELKEKLVIKDHASGLLMIRENLTKMGIIKDFNQIDAIGHRVVQGGDKFHAPVLVNEKVMQEIGKLSILAPCTTRRIWPVLSSFKKRTPISLKSLFLTPHSMPACPVTLTCMLYLMNCMKSIKSAAMVSMGLHTIMWPKKRRSF
ncbi:acetate kinase [Helicobacter pylori]|uniref:Acetate kinase n=1 Tax=Helicobacter pylori TaxID=210 RepID=A0A377RUQ3_HELPX|nr:acetate kinase [Helicobacter pylori]